MKKRVFYMELKDKLSNLLQMYESVITQEDKDAINIIMNKDTLDSWISNDCVNKFLKKCLVLILSKKFVDQEEFSYPKNFIINYEEELMYNKAIEIMRVYADIGFCLCENCGKNILVSIFDKIIWLSNINEKQRVIIQELRDCEIEPKQQNILNDFIYIIEAFTTDKYLPLFYKTTNSSIKYHIAKKDIIGLINDYINYYNFKLIILSGNTKMIERAKQIVMSYFDEHFQSNLNLQIEYFSLERDYNDIKDEYEIERKLLFTDNSRF